ncbi:AbgT family transporter [Brevibacterium sp. ZH18]|uniref:AbgT family transporter n=1 Tax=Brevibacterium sp. ZH18 TaxID=2927784 RepID=UPI001F615F43|nr:AbgT family transporter [Brevibacterium sp. ZH18]MCI4011412.1 AbgT family transporter [Brevibacterium sp. ZH18]
MSRNAAATDNTTTQTNELSGLMRLLVIIEKAGNRLPHPFWLFLSLAVVVMVLSAIFSATGLSAVNPATDKTVTVTNLFSTESLRAIVAGATDNFVTFPALGLVLIVLLGVAVAEQSGLIPAMLRGTIAGASPKWITFIVALAGTASSIASDASYMIMIPLGGLAFKAVGRNPLLGCLVAYAATSGGYSAAPMVNSLDTILGGLSTTAAQIIDPDYVVSPVANFYFNFVSMFVVAAAVTIMTELVLSKRADMIELDEPDENDPDNFDVKMALDSNEKRGMVIAVASIIACAALLFLLAWPKDSFLRDEAGSFGPESGLMGGIAAIIGFGFFIVGIVYGYATGSIKKTSDIPDMMGKGLLPFVPVIVLFFAASQFLALFKMSSLGEILAIRGAEFFGSLNTGTLVILLGGWVLVALGALFLTSGSGLWTLMAPVLVPMFMLLSISPETTQALYRIGDSTTNIISPMSPYFVVVLGFIQRYKRDAGIGTVLSFTIPLSFAMFILWGLLFFVWWATGIPWGPGAATSYHMG